MHQKFILAQASLKLMRLTSLSKLFWSISYLNILPKSFLYMVIINKIGKSVITIGLYGECAVETAFINLYECTLAG